MQVPEDLQSILTDSTLHNSPADLTTKEILSRYGDIVRGNVAKQTVQAADAPAKTTPSSATASTKGSTPIAMRVDADPSQANAWQKQSSVRPVQNFGPGSKGQDLDYAAPNKPFARTRADSDSSQASYGDQRDGRQSYGNKPLGVAS
jgi:hypothetical protein